LYKSADVAQMLIVHRENEVPGAERCRDCWSKGYDGYDFIGTLGGVGPSLE